MSFPRYPEYKDSGVEWLGKVPAHWGNVRVKHLFAIGRGRVISLEDANDAGTYPVYSSQTTNDGCLGYIETFDFDCDQITWTTDGANAGTVFLRRGKHNCTNVCGTLQVKRDAEFDLIFGLHYLTFATQFYKRPDTNGAKIMNGEMADVAILVPPLPEQTQIAAFLDRETAKVDALVAEQRRLIVLLKEKRQAVISHAVTRGLNPHAPLKPSGIEWLGDVPEHWEVLKGALIGTLFGSEQVPEEAVLDEGDLPFIKVGSLSRDSFEIESWDFFVDRSVATNYRPRSQYVVFPKRGAAIFTNKVNIVDRPSLIDPNLMGWQIGERAVTAFIAYALKCRKLDELADVSTVPQINNKHIAPERFAVPPIEEQRYIVAFLNAESAKFDTLTT